MNKFKSLVIGAFIASTSWSCQGLVDDNIRNPNKPVEESIPSDRADFMLPGIQLSNMLFQQGEVARLTGMWGGYFTGADRQYLTLDKYIVTAGDFDSPYQNLYSALLNSKTMQKKATTAQNYKLLAVGQIIEANLMGTATALWGDLPYSEAADLTLVNENPKYDSQASIYTAVQAKLDEAIVNLTKAGTINAASDILYKGSAPKWIKFANSLKARYYMHVKNYAQAKTSAGLGILATADDCLGSHSAAAPGSFNLMYRFIAWEREGYMTSEGSHLSSLLDAASPKYRGNSKTPEAKRKAWYFSTPGNYSDVDPNTSSTGIFSNASPSYIFLAEETHLILAEAEARLQNSAAALSRLNMARQLVGAKRTQVMTDYVMTDFDATGIAGNAGKTQDQSLLWEILEEKYVALFGQIETFNDIRRTNNALGIPIKSGAKFPGRLLYAQTEVNANKSFPGIVDLFEATPVNK